MDGRHPLSNSASAILYLVAGLAAVAGSAWMAVSWVPGQTAEERAFRSAPACTREVRTDCVRDEEFTVSEIRLGKKERKATLTDAKGAPRRVGFPDDGPLLKKLDDGDRVTGTVWRGSVQEIAARGTKQPTWAAPVNPPSADLAAAIGLGPAGLLLSVACAWRLRQGADANEPTWRMRYLVRLACGMGLAGVVTAVAFAALGVRPLWAAPVLWSLLVAPMAALTVRAWRRAPYRPREPWRPTPL
ncbi:hypothetical protein I5Q34_03625 [Streptomyces sp. AV19]|uniref:hypothetical protein n=1 Tax=Streptomyces sp. AV19 TaxID=2793068 RepID=UPI0018FF0C68|nr:hypothetical protein [Streptomyces sp. AV19]MBH1933383.1 hypothetical protein [Streptomyces sp. AV19]MDG4531994.1 hypothetical protein [Streptomyces sp. AV19]